MTNARSFLAPSILALASIVDLTALGSEAPKPNVLTTPAAVILKSGRTIDGGYLGGDQHTIYLVQDGKLVAVRISEVDTLVFPEHLPKRRAQKVAKGANAAPKK